MSVACWSDWSWWERGRVRPGGGGNGQGLRRKELGRRGKPSGWSKLLGKIWPEGEISQPCNLPFKHFLLHFSNLLADVQYIYSINCLAPGICLVRNVHFHICIPDNFPPDKFHFGQVPLEGKHLKRTSSPRTCSPWGEVVRGNLSASPGRLLELQLTFCKFSCCSRLCSTHTQILFKSETVQLAISKYFCLK